MLKKKEEKAKEAFPDLQSAMFANKSAQKREESRRYRKFKENTKRKKS